MPILGFFDPAESPTTYDGGAEDFTLTPLEELAQRVAAGELHVRIGRVFRLDEIVEAYRCMEANRAGCKIVTPA